MAALMDALAPRYEAIYAGVTYPRAAVALRFDDGPLADYQKVYPLLRERALVAGFAIISDRVGLSGYTTADQLREIQGRGMELLCHSRTHADVFGAAVDPWAAWLDETVGAKAALEALGLHIQNFVQPGTWTRDYSLDCRAKYARDYGQVLEQHFAASEAYIREERVSVGTRPLPDRYRHGVNHMLCDTRTVAEMQSYIDRAILFGGGCELLIHSAVLDTSGAPTTAQLTTVLDYLQVKRDAGLLTVLTPTGLAYARLAPKRPSILYDGRWQQQPPGPLVPGYVWEAEATGTPTVVVDGHGGGHAVQADAQNYPRQWWRAETLRSLLFEGYARSTGAPTTARLLWRTYDSDQNTAFTLVDVTRSGITSSAWTRVQVVLGVDPRAWYALLRLTTNGAAPVLWSDCALYKL